MTLHVDTVKVQDGRRHQRFETKFGETETMPRGLTHPAKPETNDTGTKGAKQMKRENPPSSPSFQVNKPIAIYPRWGA